MFSQPQANTSKNVCVITNGDSLLGFALSYRFLYAMKNRQEPEAESRRLRVLCRSKHGFDLDKLEEMGAEVMEVDYKSQEQMRHAMEDVAHVILIPENSSHRVKEAECMMKAAKREECEYMAMMSIIGVDCVLDEGEDHEFNAQVSERRVFEEHYEIEKLVKHHFSGGKHCIIRCAMFNQLLYYMAPQIEGENKLGLPIKEDSRWTTVDLNDVVEGVYRLAKKERQRQCGQQRSNDVAFLTKRIFEFTGPEPMSCEEMVQKIGEGLGRRDMQYEEMDQRKMKEMLHHVKEDRRFQERPSQENDFKKGRDGFASFPLGKYLNDQTICMMMEYWYMACKGHLDMYSGDLEHILGHQSHDMKTYFETNRENFKRLK
jgi:uncharacterized protein YbjT (DUF2867 family)